MEKLKLDELICLTAWSTAWIDGRKDDSKASDDEKNIIRAMRAFFKMDLNRFNKAVEKFKTISEHVVELEDKDPITKIMARYSALKVAFKENEDGADKSNLSDKEWEFIQTIDDTINIKIVYDDIKDLAYKLVDEICAPEFLIDNELLELIDFEKERGILFERSIKPLLLKFFSSLEQKKLYDIWEENYFLLVQYKPELQDMYGQMDLKAFDQRYKELKPLISKLIKERNANEKQLAKQNIEAERIKTHEYSVSNGIHYCRYCGGDEKWRKFDCKRELGHKYTLRRVKNKFGPDFSFQPVCNNCGDIRHYCEPDNENNFTCKAR